VTTRYRDADVWGSLLMARSLGMFVPRNDDERALLEPINRHFGPPRTPGQADERPEAEERPPVSNLVPLTDDEFNLVRSAIEALVAPLKEAYLRGMAVARTDDQREVLADLQRLLGPPHDA